MFTDFYHSFYYIILIIGALTGLVLVRSVSAPFKWIAILLIATIASEFIAKYYTAVTHTINNNPVYHFFTVIEYSVYAIIYQRFFNKKGWTRLLTYSVAVFLIAEIANTSLFQPLRETPTNMFILESLVLIFLSLYLFLQVRSNMAYDNLLKEGILWFNCAILCYYSFNILIWGFHSIKVYQLTNPPTIIYSLLLLLSGLLYIVFIIALLLEYFYKRAQKNNNDTTLNY